jgi:hypothetical protein
MPREIRERIVRQGDVEIVVREAQVEEPRCTRYTAELSLRGDGTERAVVDSVREEEYPILLAAALMAFAASVRLRRTG